MFGFKSYDDEYLELYEYLTQDWKMKPHYAKSFLDAYKKSIGKLFSESKKRMSILKNSSDPEGRLLAIANGVQEHSAALVGKAYHAYMGDLRRGKHVGTPVELATWAILADRSDLVKTLNKPLGNWIQENYEEKFPNLFDEVFENND